MFYWKYFSLVFVPFVLQTATKQEFTRYFIIPELQRYPWSNHQLILITKNYSQNQVYHIRRYGFHQIVTLNRKRILILTIQRVLIQICWKAWVYQYVNYGRNKITHQHWFWSNWMDAMCYSTHSQRCKMSFI